MPCSSTRKRLCAESHAFRTSVTPPIPRIRHNARESSLRRPQHQLRTILATATASTSSGSTQNTGDRSDTYFPSSLPPREHKNTRCICVKEDVGLWVLQQDFPFSGPAGINLNCVVSQLADGSLLVSAAAPAVASQT